MHPPSESGCLKVRTKEQYLPAKFNSESSLEATIEPGRDKQTLDFELKD